MPPQKNYGKQGNKKICGEESWMIGFICLNKRTRNSKIWRANVIMNRTFFGNWSKVKSYQSPTKWMVFRKKITCKVKWSKKWKCNRNYNKSKQRNFKKWSVIKVNNNICIISWLKTRKIPHKILHLRIWAALIQKEIIKVRFLVIYLMFKESLKNRMRQHKLIIELKFL